MFMKKIIFSGTFKKSGRKMIFTGCGRFTLLFFIFLVLAGVACGSVCGRNADKELLDRLDILFLTNYTARNSQSIWEGFAASFASSFIFMMILFLLGLSLWGGAAAVAVPFIKGYGYGLAAGSMYSAYGLSGIAYNLLVVMPGALLCSAVISSASMQTFICSAKLRSLCRKTAVSDDPRLFLRHYLLSMLWLLFLAALSSGADVLFSLLFSWIFHF